MMKSKEKFKKMWFIFISKNKKANIDIFYNF
jgi:hypothetical protein